jgi:hypothetical protein
MPTLQRILQRHFQGLCLTRQLSMPQLRAGRALSACRTAALGGHVQRCPNGHVERVWYNACRHRSCPQCNALARERWLEQMRARLIDCAHHHLVFTIAHELNPLWMLNTTTMMRTLFAAARDTLAELLADPRYLGAEPGMVLALHTWGRALSLHPHIHALVTDGGLDETRWVRPRRSHFLPARVVMALFRGKFLATVRALEHTGALRLPEAMSRERFGSLLNRLGRKKWHVFISARYEHGEGVSCYLARYLKGGPLHNSQIAHADDTEVVFAYTPHRDAPDQRTGRARLALAPQAFLARVLVHTPEPYRHCVRHYGLYAHCRRHALDRARTLYQQPPVQPPAPLAWPEFLARFAPARAVTHCPRCGAPLVRALLIAAPRTPP